ncbi:hypothetical protein CDL15_Pgr028281 [Punica granatum]|uniref:Uncharacterized protein n=1 Tax=Punica granatum TaxID=22663 RepID=A0A218X0F6_PUNGR|nr:hypothetical protein CDL15_Pgr028281 [Punica granatum]
MATAEGGQGSFSGRRCDRASDFSSGWAGPCCLSELLPVIFCGGRVGIRCRSSKRRGANWPGRRHASTLRDMHKLVAGLGELPPSCGWPVSSSSLNNLSVIEPSVDEVDHFVSEYTPFAFCGGSVRSLCVGGLCRGADRRPSKASLTKLSRHGQEAERGVPYQDDRKIRLGLVNMNDILIF